MNRVTEPQCATVKLRKWHMASDLDPMVYPNVPIQSPKVSPTTPSPRSGWAGRWGRSLLGLGSVALTWGWGFWDSALATHVGSAIAISPQSVSVDLPFNASSNLPSGQAFPGVGQRKFISDIPGGSLSSGERRGACPSGVWLTDHPLQVAVPNDAIGNTAVERPAFLVRVKAKAPAADEQLFISYAVAIVAADTPDDGGPYDGVLNLTYVLEDQPIKTLDRWYLWQLPETAPALKSGERYRLFVTATCVVKSATDDRSDSHVAIADLRKIAADDSAIVQRGLEDFGALTAENWSDRLTFLQQNKLWFEYLADLVAATEASYPNAYEQWTTAMGNIGLTVPPPPMPVEEAAPTSPTSTEEVITDPVSE